MERWHPLLVSLMRHMPTPLPANKSPLCMSNIPPDDINWWKHDPTIGYCENTHSPLPMTPLKSVQHSM